MSLLHATWLFPPEGSGGRLLLWADTWRAVDPVRPAGGVAPPHPFSLCEDDLAVWLDDHGLWSEALRPARASLTLPSRSQAARGGRGSAGACSSRSGTRSFLEFAACRMRFSRVRLSPHCFRVCSIRYDTA